MERKGRTLSNIKIPLVVCILAMAFGASAFCVLCSTLRIPVSAKTPRIEWLLGSDITPVVDEENVRFQITLYPRATTVYTNALKFKVVGTSQPNSMRLQISAVTDTYCIIWGMRFYIFKSGSNSTNLTSAGNGVISIDNTDGNTAIDAVGYRHIEAPSEYGSTTTPVDSTGFTGVGDTAYIIAIEASGRDGILSTQTAALQLMLVWA
jgi:hypothetical protein